jgi:hypothetical protein
MDGGVLMCTKRLKRPNPLKLTPLLFVSVPPNATTAACNFNNHACLSIPLANLLPRPMYTSSALLGLGQTDAVAAKVVDRVPLAEERIT